MINRQDTIKITVLPDGTIKVETGKISGASHLNATQFLAEMSKLAGGTVEIKSRKGKLEQGQQQGSQLMQ